jgi:hypothetical protein
VKFWRNYFFLVALPALGVAAILRFGPPSGSGALRAPESGARAVGDAGARLASPASGATATLLLEIGVILLAARIVGWLFRKIGQPRVVGEMAAGILLGPTLLGSSSRGPS